MGTFKQRVQHVQRQRGGKDLGIFGEDSLSDVDWLEYKMCEEVGNHLLHILANGRFSSKLNFQQAYQSLIP